MKKVIKQSCYYKNSNSLFDGDRLNDDGEAYCIAPGILPEEVDEYWSEYLRNPLLPDDDHSRT